METFPNSNGNVKLERYSTTTEPRTPTTPSFPNGHTGPAGRPSSLPEYDDVFVDEKLKENNNDFPHFAPPPRTPGTAQPADITWSQRRLAVRHIVLITVAVVVVVVIAVGVALAVILTQKESSSSASSQTASSSSPTTQSSVITYSGNFRLQSPWAGTREELESNLSIDFISIVENSTLQEFYLDSSLQDYSPSEEKVDFLLNFREDVTSLVSRQSSDPLALVLQNKLRDLVKEKETNLAIIPQSLILLENIPATSTSSTTSSSTVKTTTTISSSSSSTTASTTSASSPTPSASTSTPTTTTTTASTTSTQTTTTLPEECIPLAFAPCQGLGYTHYSLPNLLGSDTAALAEEDFHFLSNESLTTRCTTDPTFFCAFAFPPCSNAATQTLPCFDTCAVTIAQCVDHIPVPLDCEGYPTEQPCLKSPFPPPTTTTTQATTPSPDMCSPQTYERCRKLGFNATYYPTWFAETEAENIRAFELWGTPTIAANCHPQAEFLMCAMFFPRCSEAQKNVTLPCRSLCQEVEDRCYEKALFNIDCSIFSTDTSKCLLPATQPTTTAQRPIMTTPKTSTTTSRQTTPPFDHRCEPISIEACRHFGHVNGSLPSSWASTSQAETLSLYVSYVDPVVATGCDVNALFYLCAMLFPRCDGAQYLYPCRSVCDDFNAKCSDAPGYFFQSCSALYNKTVDPLCLEPPAKSVCSSNEFTCEGAPLCVPKAAVCNNKNDCGDWSDERNCTCNEFEYRCGMGMCIRSHKRCNGETDCPDQTDEKGCKHCPNGTEGNGCIECEKNQFRCDSGLCIMAEWVCDRQYDCENGEDELNCPKCTMHDYACVSGECLPPSQRCDGIPHCRDHSDESNCIFHGPPVYLNVMGDVLPICFDVFTRQHADIACKRLGYSGAITWTAEELEYYSFFRLTNDTSAGVASVLGRGTIVGDCGNEAIQLICAPAECGDSKIVPNFIIGGMDAKPSEVPWQASIQEIGKHFCGGSLIHPYFVLTAAHCVDKHMTYTYLRVVLGAVDFNANEPYRKTYQIKRIITHPKYMPFEGNDMALIELTEAVNYTDVIKPLCLRQPGDVYTRASPCYASGWGKTDPEATQMATRLQLLKMTLWNTKSCNSSYAWGGQILQTEICAGYYSGMKAPCHGDSGGPLFCLDLDYRWRLVGVASYVHQGCNNPEKPVVFSDAILYNTWIANHTACKFPCRNGRCLFDADMVCNKVDDCGDNSDEIDRCAVSANCTFDDPYLCGYRSSGWLWVSEALIANRYPLFDHSIGRYPGMFNLAPFRGKYFHTPRIDLTSPHCFRFRYHMRGTVRQGMNAQMHELSNPRWTMVWKVENYEGSDQWMLGQFDLAPGHYDIVFAAFDDGIATMDDTMLLPGTCKNQGCLTGEFACTAHGRFNCLPIEVLCNTVIDCDNSADEKDCAAADYYCDFENGLLCGLEQDSYDSHKAEWQFLNTSRAGFDDVSFADGTGHVLQIVTERLLTTDYVHMSHDVYLGGQEHCLSFDYRSTSTARMEINFTPDGSLVPQLVWSIENRQTQDWSRTQTSLPAGLRGQLTYTVIGRALNHSVFHPMIALDELTITKGPCPNFKCGAGQTKCTSEAFCLMDSQVCDRFIDCLDGEDENKCVCTAKEFKCTNGPCIPLERTCNTFRDCPDGSDEGTVCDKLRSVPCDFENKFMCGYTHNGTREERAYMWSREKEGPINVGTGPVGDHSFFNGSGYYAFANGENGHPYDRVALESPRFSSTGGEIMVFYYHAYSMFSQFMPTGTLTLIARNLDTRSESVRWSVQADGNSTWRRACVQLPKGNNLSVAFVAMREKHQKADMAVDDVDIRQITCDQFYLESRLQAGSATGSPPPPVPSPSGCPSGEFQCPSGLCLTMSHKCDGIKDCIDNADEANCGGSG